MFSSSPAWLRYAGAAVTIVAAWGVVQVFAGLAARPYSIFAAASVLAALFWGRGPAIFAVLLSVVMVEGALLGGAAQDGLAALLVRHGLSAVVALLVAHLMEANRRLEARERGRRSSLEAVLASLREGVLATDAAGRVTEMNAAAASLLGVPLEDAVGREVGEVLRLELEEGAAASRLPLGTTSTGRCEAVLVVGGEKKTPVELEAAPIRGADGQLAGRVLVLRDIGERRRAAEATQRSLRQLQAVLDTVPDAITMQDREGRLVFANPAAARGVGLDSPAAMLAVAPGELVARYELFDDRGRPISPAELPGRKVLEGAPASQRTVRSRDRTSKLERVVVVSAAPVLGADGRPELAVNLMHDVTERQRVEEGHRLLAEAGQVLAGSLEPAATLRSIAELAVAHFADWCSVELVTASGDLERVAISHRDPARLALAEDYRKRFPPERSSDRGVYRVLATAQPELYSEIPEALLAQAARSSEHFEALRVIGMRSAILVPMIARQRVLGVITFVSSESGRRFDELSLRIAEDLARSAALALENARLYAATEEERRRLDEANRIKDEFLATVSHELRTPLTAILGWARILHTKGGDDAMRLRAAEVIERNGRAQAQLVDDLLDVSRIISGKLRLTMRRLELRPVVEAALDAVRPAAEARGVALTASFDASAGAVGGDPDRLQQVVWNLLANAVKFTERGGRVEVRVRDTGAEVVIEVADTGAGIAPVFLPHVFDRFRQADGSSTRAHGGLGLGLSIVRHLAELHGGTVSATSEGLGQGACFSVRLPVLLDRDLPELSADLPRVSDELLDAGTELSEVRILLVEDEADTRELVARILLERGAEVTAVASARDAMVALEARRHDVLISDLAMPGEDGIALIRRVRDSDDQGLRQLPAVALTAYARIEDRRRALAAGFQEHVAKPVDADHLVIAVGRLVGPVARGLEA